mmetsp:Transcript_40404/g.86026  ORF Transcript_40404/g.86026 Transcript_40404/m.86026 type:complete len:442 (+) Transcript_40404:525-1850(+)|eukprot:CAMPEP_0172552578 /NCGR_PEP_ID=MMETSP1067-20121228/46017_1 /TAXON_ID=265564 ORGANISM="Thalassiosira punctigera, Strain Tpunct2005C2" /NCGR_SAMPLE_ID=MMETSP1067 /ASSEMBLY_ACC=CAM_ASM_000444 /LENGTH=441 /DNA_ID=CAMNT_0013340593 /DNA_START=517 /DNA_END=1842 /DNA_ORIENTATION=+
MAMNGNVQVMSNHHYSQRGGGSAPQSSHYAAANSPAHYSGQQPPPPYSDQQRGYDNRSRRGREDDEHRRRRSRSTRGSRSNSSRQNTEYPDQTNQFNYPGGGVANNVTPPSQDAASSSNLAQSSTLDATQRRPAYLLHRDLVIGKGSYGQVCIASRGEAEGHHSNKSGKRKKFACKCVMLRNDPKYIAKLQEEVNVLRELRGHDNVIRLFDVFCVDNELFIITELGRGGDLFHLLTTHPKHGVTEAYAAKTVAEMLSAVSFLHSRHICHRDLKLENWVLESGKDVWSPLKLIDFGLSTHYTPGHRLSRVVGSSYYVAPEVLKKSYTEACDLWSLGVIVYMLLSGAPPFYGKNDEAIKASIVHGEYQFPHELFRDVSDDAMAFVSCLLSYSIEYRYTAEQALTHPWLKANCDPDQLQRAKDGARGVGAISDGYGADINAMQM